MDCQKIDLIEALYFFSIFERSEKDQIWVFCYFLAIFWFDKFSLYFVYN